MKPVNSKSLLAFTFGQMEKLSLGEITAKDVKEQCGLIKQANTLLNYEIDRVRVQMDLAKHNAIFKDGLDLRNIESKPFD